MRNIYIADDFHPAGIDLLKKKFNVVIHNGLNNSALLKILSSYKNKSNKSVLVIRYARKLDEDFISSVAKITDVKYICTVSAGFDNIDTSAAKRNKIKVINTHGGNSDSTAEHTFALILAAVKKIAHKHSEMKNKIFLSDYSNKEIFGKTIGVIGVGRIGSRVAKIARAFGMNVIGNDIKPSLQKKYKWIKFASLNKALSASDFITVHTPLDKSTYHLINKSNLKLVKRECIIVNCARGGIIDETALLAALKSGKIAGACIDVFENEPNFNKKFSAMDKVIMTPHLGGKTVESKERISLMAATNIIKKCL